MRASLRNESDSEKAVVWVSLRNEVGRRPVGQYVGVHMYNYSFLIGRHMKSGKARIVSFENGKIKNDSNYYNGRFLERLLLGSTQHFTMNSALKTRIKKFLNNYYISPPRPYCLLSFALI